MVYLSPRQGSMDFSNPLVVFFLFFAHLTFVIIIHPTLGSAFGSTWSFDT